MARLLLLWLAGIDLRLTLLAVPPLIPIIHHDLGLNETEVAALTNIPVLLLAAAAIPGSFAIGRLGARGALIAGLCVIAAASMLRLFGTSFALLMTFTALMGIGIAITQPTLPSLVRGWYAERIALATSVWANGLLVGEALGASLTLPFVVPLFAGAWAPSLAVWGVPVALTAAAFAVTPPPAHRAAESKTMVWLPDFRDARIWRIGVFQSAASLTYFGANTFIPDYLHAVGRPGLVGACIATLNIAQIPASLIVGVIPLRILARPAATATLAGAMIAGLGAFVLGGTAGALAAAVIFGLASAYILVMSFALPALLARGADVARVSAGTFTVGYTIAFLTTLLAGAVWDATHEPFLAFAPVGVAAVIVLALGKQLGPLMLAAAE